LDTNLSDLAGPNGMGGRPRAVLNEGPRAHFIMGQSVTGSIQLARLLPSASVHPAFVHRTMGIGYG
jgi:hypothetical protein